ncbi:MAG: TVP38/TMEM64 family protein [Chloroflexi bacterium]|nr:TVP38/TMEM64 family protein [Chloroflexota bacterium]
MEAASGVFPPPSNVFGVGGHPPNPPSEGLRPPESPYENFEIGHEATVQQDRASIKRRWRNLAILLALTALLALAYWLWPAFRAEMRDAIRVISRANIEAFRQYLVSFGVWAPIVSALVMVLQSVLFPLPAFIVTITNGLLFGAFWGTILSWSSAMVGAIVCYAIARVLGRPAVERLVSKRALTVADRFFERYGSHSVLIARLVPVVSFDVVSYIAGTTSISLSSFLIATGIGQLPATILYSILGQKLPTLANIGLFAFGAVVALLVLAFTVKKAMERRLNQKEAGKIKQ